VEWEIANLNYYDLTKPFVEPTDSASKFTDAAAVQRFADEYKHRKQPAEDAEDDATSQGLGGIAEGFDNMAEAVDSLGEGEKDDGRSSADEELESLLEVGSGLSKQVPTDSTPFKSGTVTVQKALRTSIEAAIKQMICDPPNAPQPGPVPAPAPATFVLPVASGAIPPPVNAPSAALLSMAAPTPATAPSPMPAYVCPTPKVHIIFKPGKKMKKEHMVNGKISLLELPAVPHPVTTMVKLTIFDRPNNGVADVQMAAAVIQTATQTGVLETVIEQACEDVTGVAPVIKTLEVKHEAVKAWDIAKCENHMSKLVKMLTVHYTKRQVPMVLYNECTTFMTKISFSHDYVLDPRDAARCRKATRNFALKWKLGKDDSPKDFEAMCVNFCEAKYGNDAPLCHITAGDRLAEQPL